MFQSNTNRTRQQNTVAREKQVGIKRNGGRRGSNSREDLQSHWDRESLNRRTHRHRHTEAVECHAEFALPEGQRPNHCTNGRGRKWRPLRTGELIRGKFDSAGFEYSKYIARW
jgi:hypothetical protein